MPKARWANALGKFGASLEARTQLDRCAPLVAKAAASRRTPKSLKDSARSRESLFETRHFAAQPHENRPSKSKHEHECDEFCIARCDPNPVSVAGDCPPNDHSPRPNMC